MKAHYIIPILVIIMVSILLSGCQSGINPSSSQAVTTPVPLTLPGLVTYYPFNGNADDLSGNHINGQVHGAILTVDRFGIADHAYYFNGVDNYISFDPTKLPLSNAPRAISAWVKVDSFPPELWPGLGSRPSIVAWGINDTDQLSEMQLVNGQLQFHTYSKFNTSSSTTLELGQWYHLATVYSNGSVSLYVNGHQDIREASLIDTPIGTGRIGTWPDPPQEDAANFQNLGFFHGTIDDISIYNQALTADQVNSLYVEGGWGK
jgi:hypothetical protein